jgi:prepilin peptidase CpaA
MGVITMILRQPTLPAPGIEALLLTLVIGAAVYDVRYRRIPNWLTLGGVLAGMLLNAFLFHGPGGWFGVQGLVSSVMGLIVAFGIYVFLYALHAMGAGDVKLMGAVGAIVGWVNWFWIFLATAILGGIAGAILVVLRGRVRKTLFNVGFILSEMSQGHAAYLKNEELDVKSKKSLGLPHGAVIAAGTILFLLLSAHYTQ